LTFCSFAQNWIVVLGYFYPHHCIARFSANWTKKSSHHCIGRFLLFWGKFFTPFTSWDREWHFITPEIEKSFKKVKVC
jgi:hypothetical protein